MNEYLLNGLALLCVLIIVVLLIKEAIDHAGTAMLLEEAMCSIEDSALLINELNITLDRYYKDKIEAQAISDQAINVIAEARDITTRTIYEARVKELERAFIDRRQREKDLQDEIEKLTGGI
jgi:hypothetical protein